MKSYFKFNDSKSEDFGLVIQTPPTYQYPERDLSVTHIPGRNGDIILDNKCFKNVRRTYSIALLYPQDSNYYKSFESILDWLNSAKGKYARLEDTYDIGVYRLASFQMGGEFIDYLGKGGVATVSFECKPQRFLTIGEQPSVHTGGQFVISSIYSYDAKPLITIENVNVEANHLLMMTVLDDDNNATSSVSIVSYNGTVVLDSEEEIAKNQNGASINENISLNSAGFPILKKGNNTVQFKKYQMKASFVKSYASKLTESQNVCLSEYKTFTAMLNQSQEKILVRSYQSLLASKQNSYRAESVQSHMDSISEKYTFDSFNTVLNNYGKAYVFTGTASDNESTLPLDNDGQAWLDLDDRGGVVIAIAKKTGFYMISGKDKKIRFCHADEEISDNLSSGAINTIYYYRAVEITQENTSHHIDPPEYNSKHYGLEAIYSDIPAWLDFAIKYDTNAPYSPIEIQYKVKSGSGGYYWTDKSWIFGKASWRYYPSNPDQETNLTLNVLSWNTSKKAFVNISGLSLSTTTTFTYKYVPCTPTTIPSYKSDTEDSVDERTGEVTENVIHGVYFNVIDISGAQSQVYDLTTVSVSVKINTQEATYDGYFKYILNDDEQGSPWSSKSGGDQLIPTMKGTDTFAILYLSELPSYKDEEGWPVWLDPNPHPVNSAALVLNAEKIYFTVNKTAKYRVSASSTDDTDEASVSSFTDISADGSLADLLTNKTVKDAYYVYMIEAIPTPYQYSRSYTLNGGTPSDTLPSWLYAEYSPTPSGSEDYFPEEITYKANADGYYRWNNNTTWLYKSSGDLLTTIGGKDDISLYYMSSLPAYVAGDFEDDSSLFGLFNIVVVEDPSPHGNPKEVVYTITTAGYYKVNNDTSWKWMKIGDKLITAKINDRIQVYTLEDDNANLSGLRTTVIPRWWEL